MGPSFFSTASNAFLEFKKTWTPQGQTTDEVVEGIKLLAGRGAYAIRALREEKPRLPKATEAGAPKAHAKAYQQR
jgi:hypothetical protein